MLLYIEASFHVARGYYLLPLTDCVILAGLAMVSLKGRVSEAEAAAIAALPNPLAGLDAYKAALPQVMSAQAIAEHKATSGQPVEDLLVRRTGCDRRELVGPPCGDTDAAGCNGVGVSCVSLQGLTRVSMGVPARLIASSRVRLSQASIRREHVRLSASMDALAAQRVYIKRVKQLPEYGGSFFFATVRVG
jgi:hypothetical protein